MLVQVNTDKNIPGDEARTARVEAAVVAALGRFSEQVTRVEVHLSDENGQAKSGADDKRCVIEVRLAGHQPIVTSANAPEIDQAIDGAADKMKRHIETTLGKLASRA